MNGLLVQAVLPFEETDSVLASGERMAATVMRMVSSVIGADTLARNTRGLPSR